MVLFVATIAITRKVIVLDVKAIPSLTLIGIVLIVIALTAGYYMIKRSHKDSKDNGQQTNTVRLRQDA